MRRASPKDLLTALRGSRAVASPGCGTPGTLLDVIGENAAALQMSLFSGLLLGKYPFLDAVRAKEITYGTWHVMPPVRDLVAAGDVPFYPVRASRVPQLLEHLTVDTALVRLSPPDRHGFCSLGPSVSYSRGAMRRARTVIAELDPNVPRTRGESEVHVDEVDLFVDSEVAMPEYRRAPVDEVSAAIARHLVAILPQRPTIQIGIGAIPEAFVDQLVTDRVGDLRFAGMATDGMADVFAAGLLDVELHHGYPGVMAAELMGSKELMDFADDNAAIGVYSTERAITASSLWGMDRFVTINSALAVDLAGQVAADGWAGRQISGVGGSIDFTEAAMHSHGGVRIMALAASDVRRNSSKIVESLGPGTPVTLPRHSVDWVVTEHGAARLEGLSLQERGEALRELASPTSDRTILKKGS